MKLKKLLAMTFAVALLAGCTVEGNSSKVPNKNSSSTPPISVSTNSSDKTSTSSTGGDKTSSSSTTSNHNTTTSTITPIIEEYLIRIRASNGVTVTPSVERATKGAIVTLTVTVEEGYTLEELTVNYVTMTGTVNSDGSYVFSFTMPDADVTVRTSVSVEGDVTLTGDIAVPMVLQADGKTYAAFNVEISSNSYVAFTVGGTKLSITKIDRTKTFANIDLASGQDGGFTLAGGAKYDFFYNPDLGDECCYIQRREVTRLPSDSASLWSLFDGTVKSDPSTYPENLVGVKYSSTESNIQYEWNLYDDNSSYATVKRLGSSTINANVYKELNDGVYEVVDTYLEGQYDPTRREDTSAFSAKYKIVDAVASEFGNHQITEHDALFEINNPSHDTTSIDFDIMYGYRTGFNMEYDDSLKAYTQDIKSTQNNDGTFVVNVNSSKTYESSSTTTVQKHITYKIEIKFGKAGELLNGTYVEKEYGTGEYDFSKYEFLSGGEYGGQEVKAIEFEYTYGDKKEKDVQFDTTPYFAKSITATIHNEKLYPNATNTLNQTDLVEDYIDIDAEPATAIDLWQYRVINSSNLDVIAKRDTFETRYIAKGKGTSTLTIGNDSTNDVTTTVDVTVDNVVFVRSFYMQGESNGRPVYDDNVYAVYADVLAKTVKNVYVSPSPSNAPVAFTATSENEDLLKVTVNGQIMTLDTTGAKDITEVTSVKIAIHSDFYDSYSGFTPTTFTINIQPNGIPSTGAIGTWTNSSEGVSVTFTDEQSQYASAGFKVAYVTTATETNVEFAYSFNASTGVITVSGASINGNEFVGMFYFTSTGKITGCLAYSEFSYESGVGGEILVADIIGEYYLDEEGYFDDVNSVLVELTRQ